MYVFECYKFKFDFQLHEMCWMVLKQIFNKNFIKKDKIRFDCIKMILELKKTSWLLQNVLKLIGKTSNQFELHSWGIKFIDNTRIIKCCMTTKSAKKFCWLT